MENNAAPNQSPPASPSPERHGSLVGGIVLIVIGLLFLANNLLPDFRFGDYWPLILVAIGGSLLWKSWRPK